MRALAVQTSPLTLPRSPSASASADGMQKRAVLSNKTNPAPVLLAPASTPTTAPNPIPPPDPVSPTHDPHVPNLHIYPYPPHPLRPPYPVTETP